MDLNTTAPPQSQIRTKLLSIKMRETRGRKLCTKMREEKKMKGR